MFLVGIMSWWYSNGFLGRIRMITSRLRSSSDFFSVGLLLSTLFSPFKQISAEGSGGSLTDYIRRFFDKLLSRIIGSIVRSFMIVFGLIVMFLQITFGIMILVSWLIIPLLPIIGIIAAIIGWVPRWT